MLPVRPPPSQALHSPIEGAGAEDATGQGKKEEDETVDMDETLLSDPIVVGQAHGV